MKRQFAICGGDYIDGSGNNNKSSFENKDLFEDENFKIQFTEPYLLGMLNNGVDENGSQFFISLVPLPHLSIYISFIYLFRWKKCRFWKNKKWQESNK